jgi:hypothetical protein
MTHPASSRGHIVFIGKRPGKSAMNVGAPKRRSFRHRQMLRKILDRAVYNPHETTEEFGISDLRF